LHPSALAKRLYILLFFVIVVFYFYGLGSLPLLGPDEPRYAQVAREMFLRGDSITPTLGGHTWFEKPALLYWMIMAAFRIFGVNEWSARLGPAICGLLTIAAVWRVARAVEQTSDEAQDFSFWSVLVAASSLGLIVFARAASFDIVITMTATWALAFFLLAELHPEKRFAFLNGFYACVGLSLLAKGLVGLVIPFGVVGSYYLLRRALPAGQVWLSLLWGLPLAVLVSSIWYGPVIARHGWTFVDEFFIQHHFARYVSNKYHHPQPIYFYPAIILLLALPWSAFLIQALGKVRSWLWRGNDSLSIVRVFSLAWLAMPIIFFSFSGSKLPGYILPALPAVAFLVADRFLDSISKWSLRATAVICLALAAGGFVYALQSKEITIGCAAMIAVPLVAAAVASFTKPNERLISPVFICGTVFVLVMVILICAAPSVGQRESVKDLLQLADARGYADAPVLAQRSDDRSAQFYAHDRVVYNAEGEPVTFDEVSLDRARAIGGRIVVFIPLEYADQLKGAPNLELIGDNGRLAVFGWKP